MSESPSTQRRSSWALAAFASPNIPIAALGLPLVVYLPEFYVSTIGLSLAAVGAAFLFVRLIDISLDPFLGGIMDRTRTKLGRFRPWLLGGMPVVGIGALALFMGQPGASALYLWGWLLLTYAGYSMVVLSHTAWGGVLSSDYQQRSRIYGWWQAGNMVGMILVLCLPPLLVGVFKTDQAEGVRAMGWFIVALLPITILMAVRVVGEPAAPVVRHAAGIKQYLALLGRPSVRMLLLADLLMGLAPGIAGALFLFFFERVKHFDKTQSGVLLLIYFLAGLLSAPLWPLLAKRIGKHRALSVAAVIYAIVQVATVFTPVGNSGIGTLVLILAGIPYTAAPVLVRAMMADIGDEERLTSGVDRTGLLYAMLTGATKVGSAFAVGVTFVGLDLAGFKAAGGNTPNALLGLQVLFLALPAALSIWAAVILFRYPLDAERHAAVRAALDAQGR